MVRLSKFVVLVQSDCERKVVINLKGDRNLFRVKIQVSLEKKYTKMEYRRRTAMFISKLATKHVGKIEISISGIATADRTYKR